MEVIAAEAVPDGAHLIAGLTNDLVGVGNGELHILAVHVHDGLLKECPEGLNLGIFLGLVRILLECLAALEFLLYVQPAELNGVPGGNGAGQLQVGVVRGESCLQFI